MIFMFSYDRNILPNSFQDYFLQNFERGFNSGLRNANDYFVPGVRSEFLRRFPFVSVPSAWNNFLVEIKQSQSKNIFKSASKAYLIDKLQGFTCERLLCPCCLNTR